jgi:Uma2 family endonuclease
MSVSPASKTARATLEDLARTPGKAELINGRIVHFMATGFRPNFIAACIYRSLFGYASTTGRGVALTDNMGFAVPELTSGRESFSPDASYYFGPLPPDGMDFISGAPTFAVEVRSKGDYGDAADAEIAAKRMDYFEAGTAVVWDVDPKAHVVRAYRVGSPDQPTLFGPGQEAHAEPAVPGWRIAVDLIFA